MDRIPSPALFSSHQLSDRLAAVEYASQHAETCRHLAIPLAICAGDSHSGVAMLAAEALEVLGAPPRNLLTDLIRLIETTKNGETAYWTTTLIGRLGPAAAPATSVLVRTLVESQYLPVRERCAWALARIGTAAASAAAALSSAADNGPPRLSRLATQALESVRGMAA